MEHKENNIEETKIILDKEKENRIKNERLIDNAFIKPYPYVTLIVSLICAIIWLGIEIEGIPQTTEQYNKWGYFSYEGNFINKLYGLITTNFVHQHFIHLIVSIILLLIFGSKIEREIGRLKYSLLILSSCIIGAGIEFLISGYPSIGMSGVGFSFIGFILVCGFSKKEFHNFLNKFDFIYLLIWFLICWLLSYFELAYLTNYAHIAGFIWGMSFAYIYILKKRISINIPVQLLLIFFSILPIIGESPRENKYVIDSLKEEIQKNPDPDKISELANLLISYGKLEEAEIVILKNKKESPELNLSLGIIYLRMKKYDDSIKTYQKAINSGNNQQKSNAYYNIACAYSLKNSPKEAISSLKKAINLNKNFLDSAKEDKDFNNIKNEKGFQKLIK